MGEAREDRGLVGGYSQAREQHSAHAQRGEQDRRCSDFLPPVLICHNRYGAGGVGQKGRGGGRPDMREKIVEEGLKERA